MVLVRLPENQSGKPLPHVQAFADACSKATGANSFGTYQGHQPSLERALDIFTPVDSATLGNAICQFAIDHWNRYGVRYMIYRQRINWNDGKGWSGMADRGSLKKNHFDHVHISFEYAVVPSPRGPVPIFPPPEREDIIMFIFHHPGDTGVWVTDGITKRPTGDPTTYIAAGIKDIGYVSDNFFNELPDAREVLYKTPAP